MPDKNYMQLAGEAIDKVLPDNHGFLLLVTPYSNTGEERLNYVASIDRESTIKMLKEFLFKIGEAEDWMKHIK